MNLFKVLGKENCVALNLSLDRSCAVLCTLAEAQINNAFKYSTLKLAVDGIGIIDSKKEVSQFCIHLKPSLISDAFRLLSSGDHFDLDKPMDGYADFQLFENIYNLNSSLGVSKRLRPLVRLIREGRGEEIYLDEEWLLNLAGAIVLNEKNIRVSLNGLQA